MPANRKYPNIPEDFTAKMKTARLVQGLSQRKLGALLDMPHGSTIALYENGKRNVTYEHAKRINNVLQLGFDLPVPDLTKSEPIIHHRAKAPLINRDPFMIEIDGEVIEVLTFRRFGKTQEASRIS